MSLLCHHRRVTNGFLTEETILHRLVSVLTKINSLLKGISMEVVTQEETHIRVDYIIIFLCFFPESAAVCTSLSETDRYTVTHAKIRNGVGGALFDHLIL